MVKPIHPFHHTGKQKQEVSYATDALLFWGGREILREQSQERIVDRTSGRSSLNSSNLDQVLLFEKNFTLNKGRTHLSNTYLLQNQMCKA